MSIPNEYRVVEKKLNEIGNFRINPGLENISAFLRETKLKPEFFVVQVSGTNGKTTTSAFLSALFESSGKKTGLFISPHVWHYGERISISGRSLNPAEFANHISEFLSFYSRQIEKFQLTQFEIFTAFAVWLFNRSGVEVGVFETGLGGRFDAVSSLNAEFGVLTGIHYDHTDFLGNTLESIAYEKLHPFSHKKVYILDRFLTPEIKEKAVELNVMLEVIDTSELKISLNFDGAEIKQPFKVKLRLVGNKFAENAYLACSVLKSLEHNFNCRFLEKVFVPARFQKVSFKGDELIILEGAHNPQAVSNFLKDLKRVFKNKKFSVICGFLKDKDYDHMLELIRQEKPVKGFLVSIKSAGDRSAELYGHVNEVFSFEQSLEVALKKALSYSNLVAVTGSLYLCGDFINTFTGMLGCEKFGYEADGALRYF